MATSVVLRLSQKNPLAILSGIGYCPIITTTENTMSKIDYTSTSPVHACTDRSNHSTLKALYPAWELITILPDKSFGRFQGIVDSLTRDGIEWFQDIRHSDRHDVCCSTGSVLVRVIRNAREDTYQTEVCVTNHATCYPS